MYNCIFYVVYRLQIVYSFHMRLQNYRLENDLTLQKLADLLGVEGKNPRQTVNRYCLGIRRPIPVILERIEEITEGMVKGIDFDEHYQQVHKKGK